MVSHSVEANWRLYICMPAKSSRDRREDSAKEVPVPTTITPRPWVQSVPLEKEGSQSRPGCLYAGVGANVDLLYFFLYAPWMQRPLAARRK